MYHTDIVSTLVPHPITDAYARFMMQNDIRHVQLGVPANKEQIEISQVTIGAALSILLDPTAYPMLVHCNKGKVCFFEANYIYAEFLMCQYSIEPDVLLRAFANGKECQSMTL